MPNDEFKRYYQNISFGISESILYPDKEIIEDINSIIIGILEWITKIDKDTYSAFIKNTFLGLKYNFTLLIKDHVEIEVQRTIYYQHDKYLKNIKDITNAEMELIENIRNINRKFDKVYEKCSNRDGAIINNGLEKLKDIKKVAHQHANTYVSTRHIEKEKEHFVFISHTSLDKPLARAISAQLEKLGLPTFLDEKDIKTSQSIPQEIAKALEECTHFLLIYSNNSKDKPWVKTELDNIVMRKNSSANGLPVIIPFLLDDLTPPTLISAIKGIVYKNYESSLKELLFCFNLKPQEVLSFTDIYQLISKYEKLIGTIKSCFQADFFLPIDEDYFWDLLDAENYINKFIFLPDKNNSNHFIFTGVSYSGDDVKPCFDETFYTYLRSGVIALNIVSKYHDVFDRINNILTA